MEARRARAAAADLRDADDGGDFDDALFASGGSLVPVAVRAAPRRVQLATPAPLTTASAGTRRADMADSMDVALQQEWDRRPAPAPVQRDEGGESGERMPPPVRVGRREAERACHAVSRPATVHQILVYRGDLLAEVLRDSGVPVDQEVPARKWAPLAAHVGARLADDFLLFIESEREARASSVPNLAVHCVRVLRAFTETLFAAARRAPRRRRVPDVRAAVAHAAAVPEEGGEEPDEPRAEEAFAYAGQARHAALRDRYDERYGGRATLGEQALPGVR